jgi:hypothetical protein
VVAVAVAGAASANVPATRAAAATTSHRFAGLRRAGA